MVKPTFATRLPATEPGWDVLLGVLEDLARRAATTANRGEFHRQLAERTGTALGAAAAAVWTRDAQGLWSLDASWRFEGVRDAVVRFADASSLAESLPSPTEEYCRVLDCVVEQAMAYSLPAGAACDGDRQAVNRSELFLILVPLTLAGTTIGILEIALRGDLSSGVALGSTQFASAACELATDFYRQEQLRTFGTRENWWRQFDEFIEKIHASLDLRQVASTIANEGRRLLEVDRLSVAVARGRRLRIVATSGVDEVEGRATVLRRLEDLGKCVVRVDESLWFPGEREALAPPVEQALDACLDQSHARQLAVVPLRNTARAARSSARPLGALFVENFRTPTVEPGWQQRVEMVARHAAAAVARAQDFGNLPLAPVERVLIWLRRRLGWRQLPKTLLAPLLVGAAVTALVKVPADFYVEARGQLQPKSRREVFAPDDAVVAQVRVSPGQKVEAGTVLVELRKPELEYELNRVLGESQTARKRLMAVQAARLGPERGRQDRLDREAAERRHQLTAEEEELKEKLAGLEQQQSILQARQADLVIKSPIAGQVLTWDVDELLAMRPVQRGQVLMTVGDLAGPWQLELDLPDRYAGFVFEAQQDMQPDLKVDYLLATEPGTVYQAQIDEVALGTQTDPQGAATVRVTARLDNQSEQLRPGSTVLGKIDCGRRSLGFVWFHDLWYAIRSRLLF